MESKCLQVPEIVLRGVVHDLNNALCHVRGLIPFIQESLMEDDKAAVSTMLEELEVSSSHSVDMTRLLTCLVEERCVENMSVDLVSLAARAGKMGLIGSQLKCDVKAEAGDWTIECNETAVFRVLVNIVLNARQAMKDRDGTVRVRLQNVVVSRESALPLKAGPYVTISVSDSGEGIMPENLSRIFNPGFTTKRTGAGIGLASSAHIVKEHGGHIEVKSVVGVGTTFEIYLPRV